MANLNVPSYDDLIDPTFQALKQLGGSGDVDEIYDEVVKALDLPEEVLGYTHNNQSQTEISYRLAWARTYLRIYGAISNTSRGVWVLNNEFLSKEKINKEDVKKAVRLLQTGKPRIAKNSASQIEKVSIEANIESLSWQDKLREILLQVNPFAFEILAQRVLRECGLTQVEVTKKTGDGGIDGFGQLKLNGIISFKLAFQCKRYQGSVSSSAIRDFRGSLTTDIEKGLFITTGTFTKDARQEAVAAGKVSIDLMDGEDLINKLAELHIGLKPITSYEIDTKYFETLNNC